MQKEEKRLKFHDALLTILYPPPPSPTQQKEEDSQVEVNILRNSLDANLIPDELGESDSSSESLGGEDEEGESESRKLTRAQRKRLRKKKLKEEARRRGKIIGPLPPHCASNGDLGDGAEGVRPNDTEKPDDGINKKGVSTACMSQEKLKHRRVAKKLAKERSKPYVKDIINPDSSNCSHKGSVTRAQESKDL